MEPRYETGLVVLRRDLRLVDHPALTAAAERCRRLVVAFNFDPRQVEPHPYRSLPGLQFLVTSLRELHEELVTLGSGLTITYGPPDEELVALASAHQATAVFLTRDYTPFARNRDRALNDALSRHGVAVHLFGGSLLHEPESVHKEDGKPYTIFTPFFKRAQKQLIPPPLSRANINFAPCRQPAHERDVIFARVLPQLRSQLLLSGGRREGLRLLERAATLSQYEEERDIPALERTSHLSAHLKFGTLSLREVYHYIAERLGSSHGLIRELFWRDFFSHIGFHFPHVFRGSFQPAYDALAWRDDQETLARWQRGETGFPIVDAGMRQLATTGFMHNRVRMVVASFLTKDLQLSWREGERHFAEHLIDYDPCVNNGGWQWAASTGCDAQPYFRIFNPWLQQEKFDPEALYIKRWVPELANLTPKRIHQLHADGGGTRYPRPMVAHAEAKAATLAMFNAVRSSG